MKSIELKEMEIIKGGMKCGWVGMLMVITYSTGVGYPIGHYSGLNDAISDCWG